MQILNLFPEMIINEKAVNAGRIWYYMINHQLSMYFQCYKV